MVVHELGQLLSLDCLPCLTQPLFVSLLPIVFHMSLLERSGLAKVSLLKWMCHGMLNMYLTVGWLLASRSASDIRHSGLILFMWCRDFVSFCWCAFFHIHCVYQGCVLSSFKCRVMRSLSCCAASTAFLQVQESGS